MSEQTIQPITSRCTISTEYASKYLQQLCKHFAHKRPTTFNERTGQISFSAGECRLQANEAELLITVEATDAEHLPQLEDVVARHLVRFAFREELQFVWHRFG